ncbi:MAG TPA: hypothetical protein VF645_02945 [Allosphingosinicella sp.]|jgi:hypothetical protein
MLRGELVDSDFDVTKAELADMRAELLYRETRLKKDFGEIRRLFEKEMRITAMKNPPKRRHFDPEFGGTYEEAMDTLKAGLDSY